MLGDSSKCYCEGAFFSRVGGGNQFSKTVSKELHQSLGVYIYIDELCFGTSPQKTGNALTGQFNPVNCGGEGCANVISSGFGHSTLRKCDRK